jgi:hypothetical protein
MKASTVIAVGAGIATMGGELAAVEWGPGDRTRPKLDKPRQVCNGGGPLGNTGYTMVGDSGHDRFLESLNGSSFVGGLVLGVAGFAGTTFHKLPTLSAVALGVGAAACASSLFTSPSYPSAPAPR